ncbi:MAG TPA: aminotransferase class IV [Caulobacter sp.]|nr:aminotransferase class IV [Caulobacter sp.]
MIPLDDRGLLLGDGLFETMLALDGAIPLVEAHLDRLAAGCGALGLPALDREAARALCLSAPPPAGRAAVRLTVTAGSGGRGLDRPAQIAPRLRATAALSTPIETPASLIIARTRRNEGSPASRLKTLAYLDNVLARAEATAAGADEAVMLNNAGRVACAAGGRRRDLPDQQPDRRAAGLAAGGAHPCAASADGAAERRLFLTRLAGRGDPQLTRITVSLLRGRR